MSRVFKAQVPAAPRRGRGECFADSLRLFQPAEGNIHQRIFIIGQFRPSSMLGEKKKKKGHEKWMNCVLHTLAVKCQRQILLHF